MKRSDRFDERGGCEGRLGWDDMTESEMLNSFDMSRSDVKAEGGKQPGGYIEGTEDCLNRNIHFAIWRDPSFTTGQTVFFSEPWREKQKKIVTRNPVDTMGISSYGSFFCLWVWC